MCTTADACEEGGLCIGLAPNTCNDANACTSDSCDTAAQTCVNAPAGGPCDDGNACTLSDACTAATCTGTTANCGDGNGCTSDANGSQVAELLPQL